MGRWKTRADVLLTWLFGLFLRCPVYVFAFLAFATATVAGHRRRGHKNQCLRQLECWLTIFLVLLAIALAVGYYAYCVYGKTKRNDKETEPLMPVATATPMT